MRPHPPLAVFLIALLAVAGTSASETAGHAFANPRTIRAGETVLNVEVFDIDDPQRVEMLQRWVEEAARATVLPSGRFPLRSARVEVRESQSRGSSPVPWGQTSRDGDVAVLLYVRRDASYEQLRADWTRCTNSRIWRIRIWRRGRWLAEGLASYHQNVLRARAGCWRGRGLAAARCRVPTWRGGRGRTGAGCDGAPARRHHACVLGRRGVLAGDGPGAAP